MLPIKQTAEPIFHAFHLLHLYPQIAHPFATVDATYTGKISTAANSAYFNVLGVQEVIPKFCISIYKTKKTRKNTKNDAQSILLFMPPRFLRLSIHPSINLIQLSIIPRKLSQNHIDDRVPSTTRIETRVSSPWRAADRAPRRSCQRRRRLSPFDNFISNPIINSKAFVKLNCQLTRLMLTRGLILLQ